jgi:hypothetical protein
MAPFRYISKTTVTRPANTTAYLANQVFGSNSSAAMQFPNIAPVGGGPIILLYASLFVNEASLPAGIGQARLHLYSSLPAGLSDGTAFNLPAGDRDKYLGSITLGTPADLGDTGFVEDDFLRKVVIATSSSLWAFAETLAAFTPTSLAVRTYELRASEL